MFLIFGRTYEGVAVGPAIVDAVQTNRSTVQVHADGTGHQAQHGQHVTQQWRFTLLTIRSQSMYKLYLVSLPNRGQTME